MVDNKILLDILDRARWAPSGDNCQPWTFEMFPEMQRVRIHLEQDTDNVYEYCNGRPAWIGVGALIENIALVSSVYGISCTISEVRDFVEGLGFIDVDFSRDDACYPDDLEKFIEVRSVERKALSLRDFDQDVEAQLVHALGPDYSVDWYCGFGKKMSVVLCHLMASRIRLSIPEAYKVHKEIIDWANDFSATGIPSKALGMGILGQVLTKWAMASWSRLHVLMTYFGGGVLPRIELEAIPGLFCARHFLITRTVDQDLEGPAEAIELGRALQRFWLCATKHGLALQPAFATIVFSRYAADNIAFTKIERELKRAVRLHGKVEKMAGKNIRQIKFIGRLGFSNQIGKSPSRSIRRPIGELVRSST